MARFEADSGAVNGKLTIGAGVVVGGKLTTVTGTIDLEKSQIKGKITTVNGDLTVGSGTHVDGGIFI